MNNDKLLEARDARAIVRLLGEVCANPGDHIAKKRQLMDGICELIDADRWGWGLAAQMEPGKPSVHISLLHGGFTEKTYAAYTQAYSHPEMTAVHGLFAAEIAEKRCHLTRLRQQMDPEEGFKKTGAYGYWQAADIDGVIMSLRPLDSKTFSILGIYRRCGADLFTPRENRIATSSFPRSLPCTHRAGPMTMASPCLTFLPASGDAGTSRARLQKRSDCRSPEIFPPHRE